MRIFVSLLLFSVFVSSLMAQEKLDLTVPFNITTASDKTEYAYIAQEALRLEHNKKGKDYRDGKISKEEWLSWEEDYFRPRSGAITAEILKNRILLKNSARYTIDLENDFEENPIIATP